MVFIATANLGPALIFDHSAPPTWTGEDLVVTVPSPSCPFVFRPQVQRVLSDLNAIVNEPPPDALTSDHEESVPTWTGDDLLTAVPSPS